MKRADIEALIAALHVAFPDSLVGDRDQGVAGAYQDVGNAPRDATILNPLSGSRLMKEDAGFIRTLFPVVSDAGAAISNALPIGTSKVLCPGDSIIWFRNNANLTTSGAFWRLSKNNQPVTDWLPFRFLADRDNLFAKPISPFAGPDQTFTVSTDISYSAVEFTATFCISFDSVEFRTDVGSVQVNAFIAGGKASILAG